MAKKTIKKEIRKIALQYRRTVEDAGIPIEKMLVFGSYARGNAREDSDIDICVVSPKLGKDEMVESSRLNFLHWKLDNRIEAHPVSSKDFAATATPLIFEIKKYGVEV
ncbi:MAG: hypothetical protein A3C50_02745 [Candidatus Staskawiczbacteria bacterium RIFCSPHIGHO2_02_FULL_43_16]|uniref:Polymerase nucleotidyl transferase domain-containing protein n=1 Tax=Candidatus Staskawiczbacteria bacterium RIFCSPHIGHO2_01_FULL_41_41 TaxID=1802203 RepID=A0A1G2HT20_9BACT|nr:MAG: hypothetical protein A2822_03365 [Candidatus Staskawiczbacteria bacterium RIFCSPHIGHO2_01_FULL_41_41]OGZ68200.1 MAG: hypothetical protein A3C50_02745 [Candidatus Staskawiczbacteria bacterium RIFCSPHIGHO2_02_FULL_43_16]OGZ74989.1 MAG: hypothetical protein A3A12_04145 [Candidatus Staskawiczbacteria bacterium RIFCSPLOWO2_01_FULL_43_17b]